MKAEWKKGKVLRSGYLVSTALLALLFIFGAVAELAPQEMTATRPIRVQSALVSVPVVVRDVRGQFLTGLTAHDFELYQDGSPVAISVFLTSEDPIRIAFLLDTSKSASTVLGKIKDAAARFLLHMRPQDQATVMTFDSEIQTLCPFRSDHRALKDAIDGTEVGENAETRMRDAVAEVLRHKFESVSGRKAVLLLTDGLDHGSRISNQDLLDSVAASSTMIYSVFYSVDPRTLMKELFGVPSRLSAPDPGKNKGPYAIWNEQEREAARRLKELSDWSAGGFYESHTADFDRVFEQIVDELHHQYLLGFYPDSSKLDGDMHTLEVNLSVPGATVRSRRGYRASVQSAGAEDN